MHDVATRTDIEGMKTLIAEKQNLQLRWPVGVWVSSLVAVMIALLKTFISP